MFGRNTFCWCISFNTSKNWEFEKRLINIFKRLSCNEDHVFHFHNYIQWQTLVIAKAISQQLSKIPFHSCERVQSSYKNVYSLLFAALTFGKATSNLKSGQYLLQTLLWYSKVLKIQNECVLAKSTDYVLANYADFKILKYSYSVKFIKTIKTSLGSG